MKVVLTTHVRKLGQKGEIKEVSDGYYQNFLAPKRWAVPATNSQVSHIRNQEAKANEKLQDMKESALSIKGKLEGKVLELTCKASDAGKLYASIHEKDLAQAIQKQFLLEIPEKHIELKEGIKALGDYEINIRLHKDVSSTLQIHVLAE